MKTEDYFMAIQEELNITFQQCEEGELSNLDALIKMREAKEKAEIILSFVKKFEDDRINEISNEAESYKGTYCGFEIKMVNGRQMYSYKHIPQISEIENSKKTIEDKFKNAFIGFHKGTVQTTTIEDVKYWIDENGELNLFPELSIGKSFLTVKKINTKN